MQGATASTARSHDDRSCASGVVNARYEITFDAAKGARHPDDIDIDARFKAPSGAVTKVGGFASRGHFKVRYTPREPGVHPWSIRAEGREIERGELDVTPRASRGFVRVDPAHLHRLVYEDGTTATVLEENRLGERRQSLMA